MAAQPDYYEILQVHPAAEPEVIQAAYRRLSLKYHPDVYHGADASRRMTLLNQAYQVLGEPAQRAAYDKQRSGVQPTSAAQTAPVLQVAPREVNVGTIVIGRSRTASVHISNAGQGRLSGLVVSHVPWLHVSPGQFDGNDFDIVLRFQPAVLGEYAAPQAAEVYSNGGRATIAVRGTVRSEAGQGTPEPPIRATQSARQVAYRPQTQLAKPARLQVRLPFMAWVALGTLVSSAVWFQIAPLLAIVPLGLGAWLSWERLVVRREPASSDPQPKRAATRGAPLARCLTCNASFEPSKARKCPRCGGSICFSCGVCACRGPSAQARSSR